MELMAKGGPTPDRAQHPIELFARAYGITIEDATPGGR
jgi:hypothetical protein